MEKLGCFSKSPVNLYNELERPVHVKLLISHTFTVLDIMLKLRELKYFMCYVYT